MSTQEKATHLKACLKTIGVESPELSHFIKRSLELDKQTKKLLNRAEKCERNIENLQAKVMHFLLTL